MLFAKTNSRQQASAWKNEDRGTQKKHLPLKANKCTLSSSICQEAKPRQAKSSVYSNSKFKNALTQRIFKCMRITIYKKSKTLKLLYVVPFCMQHKSTLTLSYLIVTHKMKFTQLEVRKATCICSNSLLYSD